MSFKYGNEEIERIKYSNQKNGITNAQVNIVKYINQTTSVNEIVFQTNLIKVGTYIGNPTISALASSKTANIKFTSNNTNFTSFVFTPTYFKYGDTAVYSYSNKSWANAYKTISVTEDTYVDQDVYDWFNVNYIKS